MDITTTDGDSLSIWGDNDYPLERGHYSSSLIETGIMKDNSTGEVVYFRDGQKVRQQVPVDKIRIHQDADGNIKVYAITTETDVNASYLDVWYNYFGGVDKAVVFNSENVGTHMTEITDPLEKARLILDANKNLSPDGPPNDNHLDFGGEGVLAAGFIDIGLLTPTKPGVGAGPMGAPTGAIFMSGYSAATGSMPIIAKGSSNFNNDDKPWYKGILDKFRNWKDGIGKVFDKTKEYYRYMSKEELQAIKDTGMLRGGQDGKTYITNQKFSFRSLAQKFLSLVNKPQVRVKFKVLNNPSVTNATRVLPDNGQPGCGVEYFTFDKVQVEIIEETNIP